MIEIAYTLQKLNNFNSLVSLMSALNNSAVHRLKHTFAALSDDTKKQLEELRAATKVCSAFSFLLICFVKQLTPLSGRLESEDISCSFGSRAGAGDSVYWSDADRYYFYGRRERVLCSWSCQRYGFFLFFFFPRPLEALISDVLFAVSKFEKLHGMVSEVLSYQANGYVDLDVNEQLRDFLMELPHNSEDELFQLSLIREPRGAEKSSLA